MLLQIWNAAEARSQLAHFTATAFKIEDRGDNLAVITTPFIYPNDDPIALFLGYTARGTCILSDDGDTQHYLNDVNGFHPDRKLTPQDREFWDVNCQLYETERNADDHLVVETGLDNVWPAAFRLIQTIIHILGPEPRYDD